MTCAEVRDLLAEHALGTLDAGTRARVDRHLAWCAGCRREAEELAEGVAGLSLSLPADPPGELEDRVVSVVQAGARPSRRPGRVVAGILAAAVAMAGLAWGMVAADRDRPEDPRRSAREALVTLDTWGGVLEGLGGGAALETARFRGAGAAGGGATRYDSAEGGGDQLVVLVGGLPERRAPYTVILRSGGAMIVAGRLEVLSDGEWGLGRTFTRDLSGFDQVVVQDGGGRRVLVGEFS